jgi:Fe-S-cluster containining protein
MNHDSIVQDWRVHAERHDEKNYRFLRSLKHRDYGFDPDELAGELHEQVFQTVDCTLLTEADIERIAQRLDLSVQQFTERYLEPDEEEAPLLKMRQQPCPFLGGDNRCTIYEVRPAACREYPHTDKEGFTSRTMLHANNAKECPAVFWVVEQLRLRARS